MTTPTPNESTGSVRPSPAGAPLTLDGLAALVPGVLYQYELRADGTHAFPWATRAASEVWGVDPADLRADGAALLSVVAEPDRQIVTDTIAYSARTLERVTLQYRIDHPTKGRRTIFTDAQPERRPAGGLLWHGFATDVTEAHARQAAGATDERRRATLDAITSTLPDLVFAKDQLGRYTQANEAFARCVGRTPEELIGRRDEELVPEGVWSRIRRAERAAIDAGRPVTSEEWVEHPDGGRMLLEVTRAPMFDASGRLMGLAGVCRDVTARRASEKALRESEQRFRDVVAAAGEYVWEVDASVRYTYLSEKASECFGRPVHELVGRSPADFAPPDDAERIRALNREQRESPSVLRNLEHRTIHADGSIRWQRVSGVPIVSRMGTLLGFRGVALDITEYKRAQRDRERAVAALQSTSDGAVWHDADGRFLFANGAIARRLGYSVGEFLELNVADVDRLTTAVERARQWDRVRETGSITFETLLTAKGGETVPVEVSSTLVEDEDGAVCCAIVRDLTESRQAEQALRASEERLRLALEAGGIGLWDYRVGRDELVLSNTWCAMLGYEPARAPARYAGLRGVLHPDDRDEFEEAFQRFLTGDASVFEQDARLRTESGSWKWVHSRAQAVGRDDAGRVTRVTGVHVDIDDRKRTADALERGRHEAEQANAVKTEFLANMSHEIRTPMTAILGYADLLLQDGLDASERREHAETIRRNGEHLLGIVNDILDISKIEAGRMRVERTPVSVAALIDDAVSLMSIRAEQNGVRLTRDFATRIPVATATDPLRLKQIVTNLLSNAIKFTPSGSVTVTLAHEPDRGAGPGVLRIDIADTGIGIAPDQLGRLFGAFEQAEVSTTRRFGGTGLGLRISKRLAELMGGDITVVSEPGSGSTFTLRIPADGDEHGSPPVLVDPADAPAARADRGGGCEGPTLEGLRVLLAEDGPDNRRLITTLLRRAGAEVAHAENGSEAVRVAQDARFDVILMDVQMPEVDGYEATRRIRDAGDRTPIVALTAHAMADERDRAARAGCTGFLSKPVSPAELRRAIDEQVGRAARADAP